MTRYGSTEYVWKNILAELLTLDARDSRNGLMREQIGLHIMLGDPVHLLQNSVRKPSRRYAAGELFWYLTGSRSLDHIAHYAPSYGKFSDDGYNLNGAYGPAIEMGMELVLDILLEDPDSRRVVIPLFEESHLGQHSKDIPCTQTLQFLQRDGELDAITTMRSNDVWLGFPYDVFCFRAIQVILASYLHLEVGPYHHFVGSMHLYEKDVAKARDAIRTTGEFHSAQPVIRRNSDARHFYYDRQSACEREEQARDGQELRTEGTNEPWTSLLEMLK